MTVGARFLLAMAPTKHPFTAYPLDEIISLARKESPFFRRLYAGLPDRPALTDLPVLDLTEYWAAHHADPRTVLTGTQERGLVLNSGGSTGSPKFSYCTYEEWDSAVALLVRSLDQSGLQAGDRVANLYASGYMYSSFMFVMESLETMETPVVQLPIGVFAPPPDAVRIIRTCGANVWAGLPTPMMALVDQIEKEGTKDVCPRLILFAGESFTTDQRRFLGERFPGVVIRSIGYATVDGGVIGYADDTCGPGEHRLYDGAAVVEMIDEDTDELIEEPGRPGKIIYTNLARKLMPTLRYPTGDLGRWVEPAGGPARKFLLMGRSGESVRLGAANLPVAEIAEPAGSVPGRIGDPAAPTSRHAGQSGTHADPAVGQQSAA